jgi:V/A-type H+-transporting ATPase subunit K
MEFMNVGMGHMLALLGMGLMVGLSGAGSAIGFGMVGSATLGVMKKKPEAFGSCLIISALPSTQGLYGFVAFIMYNGIVSPEMSVFQGAVVFGAGVAVAIACLISAIHQSKIAANGIIGVGSGHNVLGNTLILAAFPEFYAILSLVAAILMMPLVTGN